MKKSGLVILGIIIGALGSYFYFNGEDVETSLTKQVFAKPTGIIKPIQAKALNDNWTRTREAAVDSAAGRPDNRSSWWSLKDMRDYLAFAEQQSDSLGYTMNGVRVYLGVYGGRAPNGKADYTTMFIVPTGKKRGSQASMINLTLQTGEKDIADAFVLNDGGGGHPPNASYPQEQ